MKIKKFKLGLPLLLTTMCVGLVACGGGTDTSSAGNGGTSNNGGQPSNNPGTSADINSAGTDDDPIFETSTIVNDVTKDDDGFVYFEDEVELNLWSIIGQPDNIKFRGIVDRFNDEYEGMISINVTEIGHFQYYNALETTYANDFESLPDICFMHNEKTTQYADRGYLYPLDSSLWEAAGVESLDFSNTFANIDRVTQYRGHRFAVPVDAHGFLTHFRQDIIKKNGLGFDGNTRFIPESRAEYQTLLEGLRQKADNGQLLIRNINRGSDHSWKVADANSFYPSFHQSTDPDGLSALYANGGSLVTEDQTTITYHQNQGFVTYVTDQVERFKNRLVGQVSDNTAMFGAGTTVMFTEGPWQTSMTYINAYNNAELRTANAALGVSEEDATDPVYAYPMAAAHPNGWWTLEENMGTENATKWYGNGHAMSITRNCKSMQKVAAALTFMKYYIEGKYESKDGEAYNLTEWCSSGHIPAWKNVYQSEDYQKLCESNLVVKALGNPEDIIAMESVVYESTIFQSVADLIGEVQEAYKANPNMTIEEAIEIINDNADGAQLNVDILISRRN